MLSSITSLVGSTLANHGAADLHHIAMNTMRIESGGNASARASTSSATGLFQFTEATWNGVMRGVPFSQATDPELNTRAFIRLTRQNQETLRNALDREPEDWETYMAHFAGPRTAIRIARASDDAPLSSIFSREAMEANQHLERLGTVGRYEAWVQAKFEGRDRDARAIIRGGELPENGQSGGDNEQGQFVDDNIGARATRAVTDNPTASEDSLVGMIQSLLQAIASLFQPFQSAFNPSISTTSPEAHRSPN
jgi:hypothetical protein